MSHTPIKRNKALQGVSREHHHGLLLCWKIRTGLSKKVAPERIKQYTDWFYETYLVPHFELEERHIFPILGQDHPWIKRALADHRRLALLFTSAHVTLNTLGQIEQELERHIRFEERELFNHIQQVAHEAQMDTIEKHQNEIFQDNTHDPFWT